MQATQKKKIRICTSNQVSAATMTFVSDEKWRTFNCFFSPTGPDPENRVGDQDIGSPGRPVSSGLQVPGEPGHCRARTRHPWWASSGFFPSKCASVAPAEMSNTPRWKFGPLEDNQWRGCRLDPTKIEARIFQADFYTRNFLGRGEPLCRHSIDCCFVSGS